MTTVYAIPGISQEPIEHKTRMLCEKLGYDYKVLKKKTRKREVVEKRQVVLYLLYKATRESKTGDKTKPYKNQSTTRIARQFMKGHATVFHAVKSVEDRMFWDRQFRQFIEAKEGEL